MTPDDEVDVEPEKPSEPIVVPDDDKEETTTSKVPTVTLNNGVKMPVIAAGTYQFNANTVLSEIKEAINQGWNHVDTAHDYCADGSISKLRACSEGSVQPAVGQAFRESGLNREDLFITTKVPGCGLQGTRWWNCGADSIEAHQQNLEELQLDYVDLLLVHFPPLGGCGPLNCM